MCMKFGRDFFMGIWILGKGMVKKNYGFFIYFGHLRVYLPIIYWNREMNHL